VRQFSGLKEDDTTPCRFLPLILHCLVKPPVDSPCCDFVGAGRPKADEPVETVCGMSAWGGIPPSTLFAREIYSDSET